MAVELDINLLLFFLTIFICVCIHNGRIIWMQHQSYSLSGRILMACMPMITAMLSQQLNQHHHADMGPPPVPHHFPGPQNLFPDDDDIEDEHVPHVVDPLPDVA